MRPYISFKIIFLYRTVVIKGAPLFPLKREFTP
nr:MAG TPA: hypothetical protein [Bacteriophage sp.]